jgi:hypothetical protein
MFHLALRLNKKVTTVVDSHLRISSCVFFLCSENAELTFVLFFETFEYGLFKKNFKHELKLVNILGRTFLSG